MNKPDDHIHKWICPLVVGEKFFILLNNNTSLRRKNCQVSRNRQKRAKAILDFERHDDDELGFKKNDIINIISMKDEQCWAGELNGLRGWFPAKFVEILDERSKDYCSAGDDSVNEEIMNLIRGL